MNYSQSLLFGAGTAAGGGGGIGDAEAGALIIIRGWMTPCCDVGENKPCAKRVPNNSVIG